MAVIWNLGYLPMSLSIHIVRFLSKKSISLVNEKYSI
jgi:hypothetical protein